MSLIDDMLELNKWLCKKYLGLCRDALRIPDTFLEVYIYAERGLYYDIPKIDLHTIPTLIEDILKLNRLDYFTIDWTQLVDGYKTGVAKSSFLLPIAENFIIYKLGDAAQIEHRSNIANVLNLIGHESLKYFDHVGVKK